MSKRAGKKKKKKKKKEGGGGRVFKRFRSHIVLYKMKIHSSCIILKYTPAVRLNIWSELILARLCVIPRLRVFIIYWYVGPHARK